MMTTFCSTNDHDSVEYIPKEYDTCAPSHIRYPQDGSLIPQNGEEVQTFFEKKTPFSSSLFFSLQGCNS